MPYVYRHIRHDKDEPFYIGIGSDDSFKRANEKSRRNNIWRKIVDKSGYSVEILFEDLSWEDACKKEMEFIKMYGRIDIGTGILSNMTDGGDGTINKVYTEEYRKKLSISAKKRPPQPQVQKIIEWRKSDKYYISDEGKKRIGEASRKRVRTSYEIELLKQRIGDKNPMFGKRNNGSFKGRIVAYKDGVEVGNYDGLKDCADSLKITQTKISACLNGRRNKTGGYTFKRIPK